MPDTFPDMATAFVRIEKIAAEETDFVDGYAWDTDALTRHAYDSAKRRHAVPFGHAAYLVDLYEKQDELIDG